MHKKYGRSLTEAAVLLTTVDVFDTQLLGQLEQGFGSHLRVPGSEDGLDGERLASVVRSKVAGEGNRASGQANARDKERWWLHGPSKVEGKS